MSEITTTRVRYSRLGSKDRSPKNTLVTIRKGDLIYFGIARCNLKADRFNKSVGRHIATRRATKVFEDSEIDYAETNGVSLHSSCLRGCARLADVKKVVNYFRQVDSYCLGMEPTTAGV